MRNNTAQKKSITTLLYMSAGIFLPALLFAQPVTYNNNCDGQVPGNAAGTWGGRCPDPADNETNWDGNVLPDSTTDAIIDAQYGITDMVGPIGDPTNGHAASLQAAGGILLDASIASLTLHSGMSNITNLQLTHFAASITVKTAAELTLNGTTRLAGELYGPGRIGATGTVNFNGSDLNDSVTLSLRGPASYSGGIFNMEGGCALFVSDVLTITSSAGIFQGGSAEVINWGTININVSNPFILENLYDHDFGASLVVQSGTLTMDSPQALFSNGGVTVQDGAVLEHTGLVAQRGYHEYAGISSIDGGGLVDIYEPFRVTAHTTLNVGTGTPSSGTGGYRLQDTLFLEDSLTNQSRFRFNGGVLKGPASFVNRGWSYTRATGSAAICSTRFLNMANFELGGGGLGLDSGSLFENRGTVYIRGGNISGVGLFENGNLFGNGELHMEAADTTVRSLITSEFDNEGDVNAVSGHLDLSGATLLNLDSSGTTLRFGHWTAQLPGTIIFPAGITTLDDGALVSGPEEAFPNFEPSLISDSSNLTTNNWETLDDLNIDGSSVEVETGGNGLDINGTCSMTNGSQVQLESGAELQADQIDNGSPSSLADELQGITVLLKRTPGFGRTPPALITTRLLNNYAILSPGGDSGIGGFDITGDFVQFPTGVINIELDTALAGDGFDSLQISGNATLAGTVHAEALPAFTPTVGQQFTFLTVTGTITGTFDSVTSTDGYQYRLIHNPNSVVLEVSSLTNINSQPVQPSPSKLSISGSLPHPGNLNARLVLQGQPDARVVLTVLDIKGHKIIEESLGLDHSGLGLYDGTRMKARHLSNGVYYLVISSRGQRLSRKVMLIH